MPYCPINRGQTLLWFTSRKPIITISVNFCSKHTNNAKKLGLILQDLYWEAVQICGIKFAKSSR